MGSTNMKIIQICLLLFFSVIYSKYLLIETSDDKGQGYLNAPAGEDYSKNVYLNAPAGEDYSRNVPVDNSYYDTSMLTYLKAHREDFGKQEKKSDYQKSQKDIRSKYIDILNNTSPASPSTSEIGGAGGARGGSKLKRVIDKIDKLASQASKLTKDYKQQGLDYYWDG